MLISSYSHKVVGSNDLISAAIEDIERIGKKIGYKDAWLVRLEFPYVKMIASRVTMEDWKVTIPTKTCKEETIEGLAQALIGKECKRVTLEQTATSVDVDKYIEIFNKQFKAENVTFDMTLLEQTESKKPTVDLNWLNSNFDKSRSCRSVIDCLLFAFFIADLQEVSGTRQQRESIEFNKEFLLERVKEKQNSRFKKACDLVEKNVFSGDDGQVLQKFLNLSIESGLDCLKIRLIDQGNMPYLNPDSQWLEVNREFAPKVQRWPVYNLYIFKTEQNNQHPTYQILFPKEDSQTYDLDNFIEPVDGLGRYSWADDEFQTSLEVVWPGYEEAIAAIDNREISLKDVVEKVKKLPKPLANMLDGQNVDLRFYRPLINAIPQLDNRDFKRSVSEEFCISVNSLRGHLQEEVFRRLLCRLFTIQEVAMDGNCLFSAISRKMPGHPEAVSIREEIIAFLKANQKDLWWAIENQNPPFEMKAPAADFNEEDVSPEVNLKMFQENQENLTLVQLTEKGAEKLPFLDYCRQLADPLFWGGYQEICFWVNLCKKKNQDVRIFIFDKASLDKMEVDEEGLFVLPTLSIVQPESCGSDPLDIYLRRSHDTHYDLLLPNWDNHSSEG